MITGRVKLCNDMEAIKRFNSAMNELECDVDLQQGRYVIDGKSIMGMFSLSLLEPINITVHTDSEAEIEPIKAYISDYSIE